LRWRYKTGEIIDSAAALGCFDPEKGFATITFISGDGFMYHLRLDDVPLAEQRLIWKFEAEARPEVSFNRWFEGNVAIGPDGTLYAGNTNFNYYAIHPDGTLKWTYSAGSNCWSQAAFGEDGTIYWGALDTFVRAISPEGKQLWRKRTLGFIAASAAVGSDGTIYIGSFDSNFYALNPRSGRVIWKYPTGDHIYGSAGLGADQEGRTKAIYIGSADGNLYCLGTNGALAWKFDAGAPIRSSPVVGRSPAGDDLVYFGCGNGRLYALNGIDGSLRWAYDTTPDDPELSDRNDLNGSPALGESGVYIGGEHGLITYVPYDYPLHTPEDPRCLTSLDLPEDLSSLYYVSPGGNSCPDFPAQLLPATQITLRLVVRQGGQTLPAHLYNNPIGKPKDALKVTTDPHFSFDLDHSGDGRYIYIRPHGFLDSGETYQIKVEGRYYTGGWRIGNLSLGGKHAGRFEKDFSFKAAQPELAEFPLKVGNRETSALVWTRLSAALPPMLPSLNQLGFDYIYWIIGTVAVNPPDAQGLGRCLLWAIGAHLTEGGELVVDPDSDFTLPLSGIYRGGDFLLSNSHFNMAITGIPIPFNRFDLRGRLGNELIVTPGATAFADTRVLSIPNFGPYLVIAGLANNWWEKLLVSGTYITRPYPADGAANKIPHGITLHSLEYHAPTRESAGSLEAFFDVDPATTYSLTAHRPGLVLADAETLEAVSIDYHANLSVRADTSDNLRAVRLVIPKGAKLPKKLNAYVMLDAFPFRRLEL
jgi:outer membrane protein assembly factor BamB